MHIPLSTWDLGHNVWAVNNMRSGLAKPVLESANNAGFLHQMNFTFEVY